LPTHISLDLLPFIFKKDGNRNLYPFPPFYFKMDVVLFSAIVIMGTIFSKKRAAEAALLNDDAPRECDTTPDIPINLIFHLIVRFLQDDSTPPAIPINLISHLILPFVQDRTTWNGVCSANKELHEAGMKMTPPWPATQIRMLEKVGSLKFSPCGSFLASSDYFHPYLVHICDRRGRQTRLWGHTAGIQLLSFSNDGNYLASAGCSLFDKSIRIWPTNTTTRLPQQSDKTLRGHEGYITCLDFSPGDSNLLASGDADAIKLWNVEQEVCIYRFDHSCGHIRSLCFPVQDKGKKCIFVTANGSLIRTWWNDLSDIESDIVDMPGLDRVQVSAFSPCGSLLTVAAGDENIMLYLFSGLASSDEKKVILYNMIPNMFFVQRLSIQHQNMPLANNCLAFSPDGKSLVLRIKSNEIQICDVTDLNIRRLLLQQTPAHNSGSGAVAFDPSGQFLASGGRNENVRLWTL
jgi:WD40 repeat protein